MKKNLATLFCLFMLISLKATATEFGINGGFTSPSNFETTEFGASLSEMFELPEGHGLKLSATYKYIDVNKAESFVPDSLQKAELAADLTGREYMLFVRAGSASDKPFQSAKTNYAGVAASKKVYSNGANGFHLGFAASTKPLIKSKYYLLPAASYSYEGENLYLLIGSLNTVKWQPAEKISFNGSFTFLGHGKVKGTYHWTRDFSTSIAYSNSLDIYYLGDDYRKHNYLRVRIASVSLEAEQNLYNYATVLLSAGVITSGRYSVLERDDDVVYDKKIKNGAVGTAELRIKF